MNPSEVEMHLLDLDDIFKRLAPHAQGEIDRLLLEVNFRMKNFKAISRRVGWIEKEVLYRYARATDIEIVHWKWHKPWTHRAALRAAQAERLTALRAVEIWKIWYNRYLSLIPESSVI